MKKYMKILKKIIKVVTFIAIFIGGQQLIKYATLDDTYTISRMMMHDLYTEKENIDVLFCGASHCQLGFDTQLLDEEFGLNTFNVGSSSQGLETTLALIKEATKYHNIKQVYIDMDYSIVMRELPNLESIYIISDYMKPSLQKISYLLNATSFDYYVNSFMPLHKGRGYTKNPDKMLEIVKKKQSEGYRNYTEVDASYAGKGHIASKTIVQEGSLWCEADSKQKEFDIPIKQQEYLEEIIKFCNKKNIQLTFVSVPVTDFHLEVMQNYDEYVREIRSFLENYEMNYYDFNLCNPNILDLQSESNFNDDNHLNVNGTEIFGKVFADFFNGKISEDDLFCESYVEKRNLCKAKILGVVVERLEDDESIRLNVNPVVNSEKPEVSVEVHKLEDTWYITAWMDGIITNNVKIKDEELR